MDFFNIKNSFKDFNLLNFKIKIILLIFNLLKLFIKYHINMKVRNINNIFKKKKIIVYKYININLNLIIILYIRIIIIY